MRFGSVCSGIEAASVAFHPLGWTAAWLSEIEPFPCAVLEHHYPSVPNLGDMNTIAKQVLTGEVEAPDLLCGGTPCQAFSVAGLRESLADKRGNLTLKFVELADAIDHVRVSAGHPPAVILWENVPGVLSTKDNAFGCFLAGLAGEDDPLVAPGGKWTNAGAVLGPKRAVAWRIFDAQYFGVAQRRRRVFVVASARDELDPTAVLFEWDGVRRDSAPSREQGQNAAAGIEIGPGGGRFTDLNPTLDTRAKDGPIRNQLAGAVLQPVAFGGNNQSGPIDVATARNACASASASGRMDFETETFLVQPAHTLRGEGFDASEDGTGRGTPLVPVSFAIQAGALRTNPDSGPDGIGVQADHAYTLEARAEVQAVCFDTTQITSATNRSNPQPGDACHPLSAGAHAPAIAFPANLSGTQCASTENLAPSMGAKNPTAVAVALRGREGGATAELGDDVQNCLRASSGGGDKPHILTAMQVRRLTPLECERLQGFPDGYTMIPWRKKPADQCPDGPRYKALGNSWAVPVAAWIGRRIQNYLARH